MNEFVIATNNPGKLREVKALLSDTGINILELNKVLTSKQIPEIVETGQTYRENARLKAQTIGDLTNRPTLADDSGLEIKALDNFPGIHSARWYSGTDQERNLALLNKLKQIKDRQARYVSLICLYLPEQNQFIYARGELKGQIGLKTAGNGVAGFGYDPIFIPQGYDRSLAELGDDVKLKISHRTQALKKLKLRL